MKRFSLIFALTIMAGLLAGCGPDKPDTTDPVDTADQVEVIDPINTDTPSEEPVVIIEEFFDFHCGFCQKATQLMEELAEDYDGKVQIIPRNYPIHPETVGLAQAAECAGNQNAFKGFHDLYFDDHFQTTNPRVIMDIAEELKLDTEALTECIESGEGATLVETSKSLAEGYGMFQDGRGGTPFFMINKRYAVRGAAPKEQFTSIIDSIIDAK